MYRPVCRVCFQDVKSDSESDRISITEVKENGHNVDKSASTKEVSSRPALTQNLGKKRLAMQVDSIPPVEKLQKEIEKEAGKNSQIKKQSSASIQPHSSLTKKVTTEAQSANTPGIKASNSTGKK